MKIIRVELEKNKLLSIPEDECIFFIVLGHVANELNAFTKMLYWSANTPANNEIEDHGRNTMELLLIRVLAGKLSEAWKLFKKSFFGKALSRGYESKLDPKAADDLQSLKKYFGSRNAVDQIRNRFAFHYSPEEVRAILPDVDENFILYLERGPEPNNLFYFSESLMTQALLTLLKNNDDQYSIDILAKELLNVSLWFLQVSDGLMAAITNKNGKELLVAEPEEVHFENIKAIQDITLPWFTDTSSAINASNR